GDEARRVRLRAEADRRRSPPAPAPPLPRDARAVVREPPAEGGVPAALPPAGDHRRLAAHRGGVERDPARGADRFDGLAAGRIGDGKGTLRAGHPPALAAARPTL